jgi:dTDP-4-dehydrorhamnose 3,5-epimerase
MNVVATEIPGALIVEPKVFGDSCGWFSEQYNESHSSKGVGNPLFNDIELWEGK